MELFHAVFRAGELLLDGAGWTTAAPKATVHGGLQVPGIAGRVGAPEKEQTMTTTERK